MPLDQWPFTGWWQVHSQELIASRHPDHMEWLRNVRGMPIYCIEDGAWTDVPMAVQIPKREIEALNPRLGKYHTSSVSWMVGYAILKGYKEIHVYGIDMSSEYEYVAQRPACEAWLGFAEGRGIKTYTPPESDLFSTVAQYGSGDQAAFRKLLFGKVEAYEARRTALMQNLSSLRWDYKTKTGQLKEDFETKEKRLLKELHEFEGMLKQCADLLQNYTVPEAGGGSPYGMKHEGNQLIITRPKADGGAPEPVNRLVKANG